MPHPSGWRETIWQTTASSGYPLFHRSPGAEGPPVRTYTLLCEPWDKDTRKYQPEHHIECQLITRTDTGSLCNNRLIWHGDACAQGCELDINFALVTPGNLHPQIQGLPACESDHAEQVGPVGHGDIPGRVVTAQFAR
jgi:hypothetical protein